MRVGHVRRAHALRGELLVRALTVRPEEVFVPGRAVFTSDSADAPPIEVRAVRTTKDGWLLSLEGVPDRTAAEQWRGRYLWAEHDETVSRPGDAPFAGDLVGLRVQLMDGTMIGTVSDFYDLPQGAVLEVARADDNVLFPLRPEFVSSVDVAGGLLVIDPPPGLFD